MKYRVNKMMYCQFTDDGLAVVSPQQELFVLSEGSNEFLEFLQVFLKERTLKLAFREMNRKIRITEKEFEELFKFTLDRNILKPYEKVQTKQKDYYLSKFSRQINAFEALPKISLEKALEMQGNLTNSKVVIIGVGGVGSYIASSLAMMGIKKLILIDHDKVELSNTSRQILYTEKDVGRSKLDVAKEKLPLYNKEIEIDTHQSFITNKMDMSFLHDEKGIDLIVKCGDEPRGEITDIIDEVATDLKIPWLNCGPLNQTKVMLGPLFIPGETKAYRDTLKNNKFDLDERIKKINSHMHTGVLAPFNGIAAKMATVEILKYLTNYSPVSVKDKCFILETNDWSVEKYEF